MARCTASTTIGTPAESARASTSSRRSLPVRSRGCASPFSADSCAEASAMSPARRVRVAALSTTRLPITRRSSSMPSPVRADVARRGTSPRPSVSSRRRTSASIWARAPAWTSSMWLSTTSITSLWLARGARKRWWMARSAYFCGSSTHTIRSVRPTSRSTSRWWPTSVESWSGRSSSTRPSRALSWWPWSSIESRTTRCRSGISSHSSSSSAGSSPQMQAVAYDVVGRRTPTAASSSPASALNVDDLPEPVAPARATTVCSAESRRRAPARSTTSAARSTTESSSRPRAALHRLFEPGEAHVERRTSAQQLASPRRQTAHDAPLGANRRSST